MTSSGLATPTTLVIFLPSARRGLRGHPYKVLQGASHRRRKGSAFSVRVVKYWHKLPASVVTAPSVSVFKKRLEKSLDRSLSPSPPLTEHSSPQFPTSHIPPAHHPLTVIISICYPTPGFFRPVTATFLSL